MRSIAGASRCWRRGAKIVFLDDAGVRSDHVLGRTWGPEGQAPEVPTSGQRQSVNAISAVSASGKFWYEIYTRRFNATLFVDLLRNFMRHRQTAVFLVFDGHPAHRARLVRAYVQSLKGKLELHFLPGYAPEPNPDEFVWNPLQNQGVSKKPLRQGESPKQRVRAELQSIPSRPRLVLRCHGHRPWIRTGRDAMACRAERELRPVR